MMLINILIAELMVLGFILIVSYIILYLSGELPEKDDARITYKQFRIFDAIAPEKWTERSFNSLYYTDEYNHEHIVYMNTPIDIIQLILYVNCLTNEQKRKVRDEKTLFLVKEWQKDISTFYDRNEKWMDDKIKTIINIENI